MKKHPFLCVSFLLFFFLPQGKTCLSKSITFEKYFGGAHEDYGYCVDQTPDGGYIIGGSTRIDDLNTQAYIIKTDKKGNKQWEKIFGEDHSEFIMDAKSLRDGFIFAMFSNSNLSQNFHLVLLRTDLNGDELWRAQFDGPNGSPLSASITIIKNEEFIVAAGYMFKLNPLLGILAKVHQNGKREWAHTMYNKVITCVKQSKKGQIYLTGFHREEEDMKSWLAEFDIEGRKNWQKTMGSGYIFSMDITRDGGIIFGGLNPVPKSVNWVPFLIKSDNQGMMEWSQTYNAQVTESHFYVTAIGKNGYVFTALHQNSDTMNGNLILVKTDKKGTVVWWRNYGTPESNERGICIKQTIDKGFIVTGITNRFEDNQNIYLLKTDESGLAAFAVVNKDND